MLWTLGSLGGLVGACASAPDWRAQVKEAQVLRTQGHHSAVADTCRRAAQLAEAAIARGERGARSGLVNALVCVADARVAQHNHAAAAAAFADALARLAALAASAPVCGSQPADQKKKAFLHASSARALARAGQWSSVVESTGHALERLTSDGDPRSRRSLLILRGNALEHLERFSSAADSFAEALALEGQGGDAIVSAHLARKVGKNQLSMGDVDGARKSLRASVDRYARGGRTQHPYAALAMDLLAIATRDRDPREADRWSALAAKVREETRGVAPSADDLLIGP
jgi:tetratricopeptide (TPR) repeat protein